MESSSDQMLLEWIIDGSEKALFELFGRKVASVRGVVGKIVKDPDAVERAVRKTVLELWATAPEIKRLYGGRVTQAVHWIAVRQARGISSSRQVYLLTLENENVAELLKVPSCETQVLNKVFLDELLSKLEPQQRRLLELSFFEGLPHGKIATLLDMPVGTVKTQLRMALLKLRRQAEAWRDDDDTP